MFSGYAVADIGQALHRKRHTLVCILAAILGFLLFATIPRAFEHNATALVLDLRVSAGTRLEVYVNENFNEPLFGQLIPGQRKQYKLKGLIEDIRSLRIYPGEASGAEIDLFGIWTEDAKGPFARIPAEAIANWNVANLTSLGVQDSAARFVARSNDPILMAQTRIALRTNLPAPVAKFVNLMRFPRSATLIVIILGSLVLLAASAFGGARVAHPLIAIACSTITVLCVLALGGLYHPLAPIDTAVGQAGFHGLSATPGSLGILCSILLCATVAAGFALFSRKRHTSPDAAGQDTPNSTARGARGRQRACILVLVVGIFLYFFPNIEGLLQHWLSQQIAPDWDGNNGLIWDYMAHIGSLPFRDFWYPYSGMFVFGLPAPTGPLLLAGYKIGIFVIAFYALYILTNRNWVLAALAVIALIIGGATAVYWGNDRYLQSLSVALIYLAIDRDRRRIQAAHFWFWAACGFSLFFEPAQLAYAAPAVLTKILLDLAMDRPFARAAIVGRLARDFAIPALFLIAYLAVAVVNGQIANIADFYLGLGDQALASAQPTNLRQAVTDLFSVRFLIVVAPMAMIGIGLYDRIRAGRAGSRAGDTLLVLGLVGAMILQKHLVRPIDWQLFVVPALGCFAYAALARRRRTLLETAAAGALLGAYIATLSLTGVLTGQWEHLKTGPARLYAFLASDPVRVAAANDQRFAPARFVRFKDETRLAARLRTLSAAGEPAAVFVLTDNQALYILLEQHPPYHANAYNSSPLYEQRKVLQWLTDHTPRFAVLDRTKLTFDAFQTAIRVPLYYNYVIEHYVPQETVGALELLRQRQPDEPVATAFWRATLGDTLDFGHFPRASSARRLPPCTARAACQNFLKITIENPPDRAGRLHIPFNADGFDFAVAFNTVPGSRTYFLSLDRIWFWKLLNRHGKAAKVALAKLPPGVSVEQQRLAADPDLLY